MAGNFDPGRKERIIISIGGNAIVRRQDTGTIEEQFENAGAACKYIARMATGNKSVIVTHGNGPIVGNIVIRNEAAKAVVPPMPLYICDADSEGGIGFVVQQTLYNHLHKIHNIKDVITIVTQIVVDPDDPAFKKASKPIGPFYAEKEARALMDRGWVMAEDSKRGYRRVVPSPRPKRIIESDVIRMVADSGVIVIAAGGGGVPVIEKKDGTLSGIDAVIDKDLATSLLAREVKAAIFINLTQIDQVYVNFGKQGQKGLRELSVKDAARYLEQGEFAPGSMGPKIEAAIEFIEGGGKEVIITSPELLEDAIKGMAGTRIF